jgi:sugar lactone lactonase YvrE
VSGATVTLIAAGTCIIQATQAGSTNWAPAPPVNQSFFVGPMLGTNSLLVGSAAGASSVILASNGAWTATSNSSFLHLADGSASGTGNGIVVFTYDAFAGAGARTGTLTIAGLTLTVTQAGTNYIEPGPVTTLVSTGLHIPEGVAVDDSGNVYISDTNNQAIKEWNASTQQVTTLVSSGLDYPDGVAVDAFGNVYIADVYHSAIKQWSPSTQQVTTLATPGLYGPEGVAVDGAANVYIADSANSAVKKWSASSQQLTTLVSTGLDFPRGVAVDLTGNVYISDSNNRAIKEWDASTHQVTTLVSSGLIGAFGVAVDGSGNLYIAEAFTIKKWSPATQQLTTLVSSAVAWSPEGVAVDGAGNVYIADSYNGAIKEMPYAFVGPASLTEPVSAGSDALLQVLPSTTSLAGIFAPTSDQNWLTIGAIANGVVSFSFTANTSGAARTAHITVLGQQIAVTQNAVAAQTIAFGPLSNQPFGTAPFTLSATASSGLPVSFNSTTSTVCTVSDATVTLVAVGTCTIQATQAGDANWAAAASVTQSFAVTKATPTITWPAPAAIAYGTALSAVQLNAAASVPGTFAYTPAAGTVLSAGNNQSLSVTFTPADTADYNAAAAATTINVNKAPATVTLGSLAATYDGTPKSATATTMPANLVVALTYNGNATPPTAVGAYAVVASVNDPNYAGSASGTLTINGVGITLATSPTGLLVSVDGAAAQAAPFTLALAPGVHTIAVASIQAGAVGTQYVLASWSDAGAASHSVTVGAVPATYTATFKTQYQLITSASPSAGGTVTPATGAFFDAGSLAGVQAYSNAGYQFANFSSGLSGSANPQNVTMNAPVLVVANFTPLAPALAASLAARVDGIPGITRLVTLNLTNTGLRAATNATIASITAITVVAGSGAVTVASGTPVDLGTIAPATAGSGTITFNWPATATRVRFTVNFTADGGYTGSTTVTTIR